MAYLVYCPTCGGKMSSNAYTCPHCGETEFQQSVKRTCDCRHCNGTGKERRWKNSIKVLSKGKAIVLEGSIIGHTRRYVIGRDSDGNEYYGGGDVMGDNVKEKEIRQYINRGDYTVGEIVTGRRAYDMPNAYYNNQYIGQCNATMYYGLTYAACSYCDGTGKGTEYVQVDTRKKV